MAEPQHFSHECLLTSPKIVAEGICSICYKDEVVELACNPCEFNLCKACSHDLPQKVSHDFHPDHPLEFCVHKYDQKPGYIVCSGCGNMSSGSFYKCKECEIYLDLDCALSANIFRGWGDKDLLHYSHCHLLKRCRPGPDARGSCLLCELPLSPSAICYGCVHCYSFVHERCIDFPREIAHPVHPAHPLKRLDYTRSSRCDICGEIIASIPFGCLECVFDAHLRCLDSFLRGLMHKSHQHMLIYRTKSYISFTENHQCQICGRCNEISLDSFFYCMECCMVFHFECLEIPEFVVAKSHHIHPLVCKLLPYEEEFLEYCGVCETMVYAGHHVYSCEECGFLGHIECILRKEVPSPLYLKDLYACSKDNTSSTNQEDHDTNELETKLMVNSMKGHIHVMRFVDVSELDETANCNICKTRILSSPCKCETCSFQAHNFCAELGRSLKHRVHKHPLTLLPEAPAGAGVTMNCDICTNDIQGFNLFCRLCNFVIHTNCIFKGKHLFTELQRGQKIIGSCEGMIRCIQKDHSLDQIMVSKSYSMACAICEEKVCGKDKTIHMSSLMLSTFVERLINQSSLVSCLECEDVYHPLCVEVERQIRFYHPLHPDHNLRVSFVSGSKCSACKLEIRKYGYHCSTCEISFHIKCIKAVRLPKEIKPHSHYFYHFWIADSTITRTCRVCARPCGVSFYGCISCDFNAHAECIGFPSHVKNQQHQHTLVEESNRVWPSLCSLCGESIGVRKLHGRKCSNVFYSCQHCGDEFHLKCIMSTDGRETATEEDQVGDIYLMYLERHLLELLKNDDRRWYLS
ncbi:unnamed protein product [Arabidopsis lyrata]|uniref:uncharacterized protein LOC9316468 n=1 Tax=Arabidopsis lyrata subsp. lyrata TaxID=81972 RepID=UPI000A29E6CB|nr:uncharacterized protein LOC9316468 [Arabidopsis lyrata subsp. lyrata]CAH8263037.1 unnamed protein product [Arabidopsis lyrata]|eukprot:XP_002878577.2 uncharacterized protein LOC9316468 [Arabidopsis lyrata subsp. lyrata]